MPTRAPRDTPGGPAHSHTHAGLLDMARLEAAAATANHSAQSLFGYLTRLDGLRGAELSREALADRAADAELNTRLVLRAGMEAYNELQDLGLLDHALQETFRDTAGFNEVTLAESLTQIAKALGEQFPNQRWDWIAGAAHLVEGVSLKVESDGEGLRGAIIHQGRSTVVPLSSAGSPRRVSTAAFFSAGADRVYAPTSRVFDPDEAALPAAPYDAAVGGMAFAREWVYRHARNAAELGPPSRTGGGPVIAVIIIVLVVISALAAIAVGILYFACTAGSDTACRWAVQLGVVGALLGGSAKAIDANSGQAPILTYNTNQ